MTTYKTEQEQNKALNEQGIKGYEGSFTIAFRISKKKFFIVKYGSINSRNQEPYFSTSGGILNHVRSDWNQCGQCQKDILSTGLIARKFYDKWDEKHLSSLTLIEYDEMMKDLELLKEKYSYIDNDRFYYIVNHDRVMSK